MDTDNKMVEAWGGRQGRAIRGVSGETGDICNSFNNKDLKKIP